MVIIPVNFWSMKIYTIGTFRTIVASLKSHTIRKITLKNVFLRRLALRMTLICSKFRQISSLTKLRISKLRSALLATQRPIHKGTISKCPCVELANLQAKILS